MEGFDDPGVYYSQNIPNDDSGSEENTVNFLAVKKQFKDFLREFSVNNFNFIYRDTLKRNYNQRHYCLEVNLQDLSFKNEFLADKIYKQPLEYLGIFEEAAKELADELTSPRPIGEENVEDIQIILHSSEKPSSLRNMKSDIVSKLVKIPGIIVSASGIKSKATSISIQCRSCNNVIPNLTVKQGLDGFVMPRKCSTEQSGGQSCPLDPYFIMPDKCKCIDFQVLKLQELPDSIPQGEIPRHLMLFCDRYLCEKVVPGNRIYVIGVYSIKKITRTTRKDNRDKGNSGVRAPYMRVLGLQIDEEGIIGSGCNMLEADDEEKFKKFAASPDVYEKLVRNIAPSIYGSDDIKKAILCLLFSGSRKRLPDGLNRRGDINILLLGDPGTAKSQLLKFVERVAPIGVYTSGKGSSAAGLTASVIRDPQTRNFIMEGGAMVLADGGVVCIDEFDKMREDDRVAIHEAMEQQTISIAKAGITTTLNSRCSVLAAANSIFGRWDETKGDANIDFMPTILSRFDMIFIVKDEYNQEKDMILAKHVMKVHMSANQIANEEQEGDLSIDFIKKYIHYCRSRCGPRLTQEASELLKRRYVRMRSGTGQHEQDTNKRAAIPITVRQLEAIVRISESLAKMQLLPYTTEAHVMEAMRLFQVSTLDAAMSGGLAGAEEFTTEAEHEMLSKIEKQLKKRFAIGTQVSQHNIIYSFIEQQFPERAVLKVIYTMIRRGQLQHRMQRKLLYRIC